MTTQPGAAAPTQRWTQTDLIVVGGAASVAAVAAVIA
jgi:hypothetical protein